VYDSRFAAITAGRSAMSRTIRLIATLLLLLAAACASTARTGYLYQANQRVNEGRCAEALDDLSAYESLGHPDEIDVPQLSFLKAQCFEQMGRTPDAIGLYDYIATKAPDSPYAFRAKERLEALRAKAR
jgi:hypothetical protein